MSQRRPSHCSCRFLTVVVHFSSLSPAGSGFITRPRNRTVPVAVSRIRKMKGRLTVTGMGSLLDPETKLKPRWDVHLSGDGDQLGCAGESLSSVLGE